MARGYEARLSRYQQVATALARPDGERLARWVDEAPVVGSGIGGHTVRMQVAGAPVFVKRVPLTDLERRPEHVHSTANLFGLPVWCQYGVGSAGQSAWRELAAHVMTTEWVVAGECGSFPLLYHWRVLPRVPESTDRDELDRLVAFWHGSPAVRERLEARADASADVVLFLEHVPRHLQGWLTTRAARGPDAIASAAVMVERELRAAVTAMNARGLLHLDAHFRNVLTDGHRLYVADFGLAISSRFALNRDEVGFVADNASHDACYVVTHLVNWLVTALTGQADPDRRNTLIRRWAEGDQAVPAPPRAATIVTRYAPVAVVMNEFYRRLHLESRTTPYPVAEIDQACAAAGFAPGEEAERPG